MSKQEEEKTIEQKSCTFNLARPVTFSLPKGKASQAKFKTQVTKNKKWKSYKEGSTLNDDTQSVSSCSLSNFSQKKKQTALVLDRVEIALMSVSGFVRYFVLELSASEIRAYAFVDGQKGELEFAHSLKGLMFKSPNDSVFIVNSTFSPLKIYMTPKRAR